MQSRAGINFIVLEIECGLESNYLSSFVFNILEISSALLILTGFIPRFKNKSQ